jgi:aminoglycoside phosphotransferase (APT) family kinase protein
MAASKMPAAEVDVTPELVQSLLELQHPDLAGTEITLLANGWDNVLYRIGPELVARLPRREAAATLVDHECRWLPDLAPRLPIPVPVPVHTGEPTDFYPWRWTIVPWFEGEAIGTSPLGDPGGVARSLGEFVSALHRPAPTDYPHNPYRGVPLTDRAEVTEARLSVLDGQPELKSRVEAAWVEALQVPLWESEPIWLHGDLHPANILLRHDAIAAVIDFGDVTAGDPATDLLGAWALFDADHRSIFRESADSPGRRIDDAMWARGRGWAVTHGLAVVASSADNASMHAIGMQTLEAAAEGCQLPFIQ